MLTTVAERIKAIMVHLNYSQDELAAKLGLEQSSVSVWLKGGNLRASTVQKFESALGISPAYLQNGVGDMFLPGHGKVEEPLVVYGKGDKWSEQAIRERFTKVVNDYKLRFNMKQKEVCEEWNVNESHVSKVMNGINPIATGILLNAMRYGNVNLNYVMGGIGGYYNSLEASDGGQLAELVRLVKEQGEMIAEMQQQRHKKRA